MKLPKQLPAVDRNSDRTAAVPVGANVGPSFDWGGLLGTVAQTAIPLLAGL